MLIVDPARVIPQSLEDFLTKSGYESERAGSAPDALHKLGENHYPVVFVGLNSGEPIDLLDQVKSRMRMPGQLLAVGPDKVSVAVEALQAGARHYWSVPLDLQEVERKLSEGPVRSQPAINRYQREGTLLQVIKEIALTMELDGLVNILMDSAMELAGADAGSMLIQDERTRTLSMKAIRGMSGNEGATEYFGLNETRYDEILNSHAPVFLRPESPMIASNGQSIGALIAVPIWWKEEALGLLVTAQFATSEEIIFQR